MQKIKATKNKLKTRKSLVKRRLDIKKVFKVVKRA